MPNRTKAGTWGSVAAALISAIATVIVSFIGVFPQLRQSDQGTIATLTETVATLKKDLEDFRNGIPDPRQKYFSISGVAYANASKDAPMKNIELYLVPSGLSELVTMSDDNGNFYFPHVPDNKTWWIITRNINSTEKSSGKVQIDTSMPKRELPTTGAYLTYTISDQ